MILDSAPRMCYNTCRDGRDEMSKLGPRVFVTHEKRGFDYSGALEFGEVIFLTRDEYLPLPTIGGKNDEIWDGMFDLMSDYRHGYDLILLSGSPVSMFIAGSLASSLGATGHKVLKWNNHRKSYDTCII